MGAGLAGSDPLVFEPRESIARTVAWMPKVRAAVGDAVAIGVEYHHRLSVAEAGPSRHGWGCHLDAPPLCFIRGYLYEI